MSPENDQTRWIGVRPTNPAENIPVTESTPLTDILVGPSVGAGFHDVNTRKLTPAICDLQAPESFVRVSDVAANVGAPNYAHNVYTVPAGKVFKLEMLMAYCFQTTPTQIDFILVSGGVGYVFYNALYGLAWERHRWTTHILFDEDEIVRVYWTTTLAGTTVMGGVFGHLFDKY